MFHIQLTSALKMEAVVVLDHIPVAKMSVYNATMSQTHMLAAQQHAHTLRVSKDDIEDIQSCHKTTRS
jgi:hypothetical protein